MRTTLIGLLTVACTVFAGPAATAEQCDFNADGALSAWTVTGDVTLDKTKNREGEGASLKVGPGGKAVWTLRDSDGSGTVEMWVYEDGSAPAKPKDPGQGSLWGVGQKDGHVLAIGSLYARYLGGDTTYSAGEFSLTDAKLKPWQKVQYLGLKRNVGWHKWTFSFDPGKGLALLCDGKPIKRYDWNKSLIGALNAIVITGDQTADRNQTVWIDDVTVTLGGPMQAAPTPPAPPPPATPETDPVVENFKGLRPELVGQHPRLIFDAAGLEKIKAFAASDEGKLFWDDLLAYVPACNPPQQPGYLGDATDGQRQGLWKSPSVGLHYLITGDKKSFAKAKGFLEHFVSQEHWETGQETDSGMSAANIMIGAGLLYDWLYNDLDPAFREKCRQKILLQARRMYYRGHLSSAGGPGYWKSDPQNNHRWHRNAGLTLCLLAAAENKPEEGWILQKTFEELKFIVDWLPEDGTSHESPSYMVFGGAHLALAMQASDRCYGTNYLDGPFFKNTLMYRMQTLTPGLYDTFDYGDSGGTGGYNSYHFLYAAHCRDANLMAGLKEMLKATTRTNDKGREVNSAFQFGWMGLVWYDPTLTGGSIDNLPRSYYFGDMGLVYVRDGWKADNVGLFFKSSPYGGFKLNKYRNDNEYRYLNVAHDDPDANQFQIWTGGGMAAQDDGYAYHKVTSSHNTILVNGKGQAGEGQHWTQPGRDGVQDMTTLARMTAYKDAGDVVVAEAEAGGAYKDLDRYRRTVIWAKGKYALILDDIRARKEADVTWLVQSKDVETLDAAAMKFQLKNGSAVCDFQMAADKPLATTVAISTADSRGNSMDLKQLQATAKAAAVRIATVFDPWHRGNVSVALEAQDGDNAKIVVKGPDFADVWTWQAATGQWAPASLSGQLAGGKSVSVGPQDKADIPHL
ncbi:MAG: heparinase II/III family protein [Planctomycetes bacterium]|nr:heparinase II/III family protein [Planctomycetota bacterium]